VAAVRFTLQIPSKRGGRRRFQAQMSPTLKPSGNGSVRSTTKFFRWRPRRKLPASTPTSRSLETGHLGRPTVELDDKLVRSGVGARPRSRSVSAAWVREPQVAARRPGSGQAHSAVGTETQPHPAGSSSCPQNGSDLEASRVRGCDELGEFPPEEDLTKSIPTVSKPFRTSGHISVRELRLRP
jgi:hypothetical protein